MADAELDALLGLNDDWSGTIAGREVLPEPNIRNTHVRRRYVTIEQACDYLGCHRMTVHRARQKGVLAWRRLADNRVVIERKSLVKFGNNRVAR